MLLGVGLICLVHSSIFYLRIVSYIQVDGPNVGTLGSLASLVDLAEILGGSSKFPI